MSISRRHFLGGAGAALGWLVAPKIARQIVHLAEEHERILEVNILNPVRTLYVDSGLTFHLGDDVFADRIDLTYRDWFELREVDPEDPKRVLEYMTDYGFYDPEWDGKFVMPKLDDQVSEAILEHYIEWDYSMYNSPNARAYHYLEDLPLDQLVDARGEPLGELRFYQGPCPGSNYTGVEASNLQLVSGLQQRLIDLGEDVKIEMIKAM